MEDKKPIGVGDSVRKKAGGSRMRVVEIIYTAGREQALCHWIHDMQNEEAWFDIDGLDGPLGPEGSPLQTV